jgi:hypothetical protein
MLSKEPVKRFAGSLRIMNHMAKGRHMSSILVKGFKKEMTKDIMGLSMLTF